jgi:hypothetical protein
MLARASLMKEQPAGKQAKRGLRPASSWEVFSSEQELDEGYTSPKFSYSFAGIATAGAGEDAASGQAPSPLRWPAQAKLAVGAVDDPLEHEANRVAEQVLGMDDQRSSASIQSGAAHNTASTAAPPQVYEALSSPGEPLAAATRAFFEPRFGHDFSQVRLHSDPVAEHSALALDARAYTVGPHIVLGPANTPAAGMERDRLIAHELAHVVQQTGAHANRAAAGFGLLQRDDKKSGEKGKAPDPVKAAKEKLKTKYKLGGITEEDGGAWTQWELRALEIAISKMSKDEQAQLEGVTLIRTNKPLTVKNKGKDVRVAAITTGTEIRFGKNALTSKTLPLHEVGHVLEHKAVAGAEARVRQSDTWTNLQEATELYNAAARRAPRSSDNDAIVTFLRSINAVGKAAQDLLDGGADKREEKEGLLVVAQSQADIDRQTVEKITDPAAKAILAVHDRQREWVSAIEAWLDEKEKVVGARKNLTEFVDIVKKNHLARKSFAPFTDYVASFWPHKPDEFFAECYATYRNNPNYLKSQAKPLFEWFEKKGHLLLPEPPKKKPTWYEPRGHLMPEGLIKEAPVLGEVVREAEQTFLPALQGGLEILRGAERQ